MHPHVTEFERPDGIEKPAFLFSAEEGRFITKPCG